MSISVNKIAKQFGKFPALKGVDLEIREGELLTLLGPSGSGKTTLLRILGGLEIPDSGQLLFDGQDVTDATPEERRVGLVFQNYALFAHMSVYQNIAFGLRVGRKRGKFSRETIARTVNDLIGMVQLTGMERRFPNQLSGGQQQRVGLARALAIEPRLLLLDEPFGALDAKVRKELRDWVRGLQRKLGITTVFVTHDQEEALELSDRIVVMSQGAIEQIGTPPEIYNHPATPFVCEFIGNANKLEATVVEGRVQLGERWFADAPAGAHDLVTVYARPGEFEVHADDRPGTLAVIVTEVLDTGPAWKAHVTEPYDGARLELELPRAQQGTLPTEKGATWYIRPTNPHVFPTALVK